ncbi:hypothetical protein B0I35DRAFT_475716 [Stachybotrys elegans]|uniref:Rhodopsin domain-containing protein n=1 Tax=Stachybotrys elegans TaxID=80388 RepID=A0A8K0SX94_9HYPO|nr:hypothetical protein B0I35DRAFT_475716 [Stachybotrys elegans]
MASFASAMSDEDRGPLVIGVSSMMSALATITMLVRAWTRVRRGVEFGIDDGWILVSFCLLWVHFVVITLEVIMGGLGVPLIVNLLSNRSTLADFLRILFVQCIVSPIAITVTKFSYLAMYWRFFPTPFTRRSCMIVGGLQLAWCLAVVFPTIFRCNPIEDAWRFTVRTDSCNLAIGAWLAWQDGIPEIATTIMIYCLPLYEVSRLHTSRSTKLAISAVFFLCSLTVIASIMRFVYAYEYIHTLTGLMPDATLGMANVVMWCHIEVCTGFIAACLPALRPVAIQIWHKLGFAKTRDASASRSNRVATIGGSGPSVTKSGSFLDGLREKSFFVSSSAKRAESSHGSVQEPQKLRLWPDGYRFKPRSAVWRPSADDHREDLPLRSISVRTDIMWREDSRTSKVEV